MVRSVVLAEDSLEHCFFFKKALQEVGPQTMFTAVHDGDRLMALLESYLPEVLFLDLSMPCKNGVQCIKEIRQQSTYDSMPIIVFSVTADERTIQSAYRFGANLYLVKPDEYSLLRSALQNVLSMDWQDPKKITERYFYKNKYIPFAG
jgi:CheY-like chemotaxis protein